MRIKSVEIKNFKRFTNLNILDIPATAKLIVLVGPNGSGKTSLFEAFNHWYKLTAFGQTGNRDYFEKKDFASPNSNWFSDKVQIKFYEDLITNKEAVKGRFYFRTAYRNEADFTVSTLSTQYNPIESVRFDTLNGNDITVSENYQRLISQTLAGVFNSANDSKTVEQYREELVGHIKNSLKNIFDDLTLSSIGDPLSNGSFYFEKGSSKDFHYKNLSAGEKSVFDIILDLIIKTRYFPDSIFCIDEPEAHMHTRLQARFLSEMFRLVPENSQLWISTHSIGMLKQAEDLEKSKPNSVVFLDFDNRDFDSFEVIKPAKIDRSVWDKFFELSLADFSKLIAPKKIVFCEGTPLGRKYKNFDAQIYTEIFAKTHYDAVFVSIGSSNDIENIGNQSVNILANILKSSEIIKIVDRDNRSSAEVKELNDKGIKTLAKRHLENYLLDDEIISKLCEIVEQQEKRDGCLMAKQKAINDSVQNRKNFADDIKSASGEIYNSLKEILGLTQGGNNTSSFLRDTMAPLITEETTIYKELEKEIFG